MDHPRFRALSPHLLSGLLLLLTVGAWVGAKRGIRIFDRSRILEFSNKVEGDIRFRMQTYVNVLEQTRNTFKVIRFPTRKDFKQYYDLLQIQTQYPGIQGIGYAKHLSKQEIAAHEEEVRREGFPDYKVWPMLPARQEYTSIIMLEPFDWRNKRAFGFDMFSEKKRRSAMVRARRTGEASITGPVRLVQETEQNSQAGFLIYVPLYTRGKARTAVHLEGYVYAPFRARDLFQAIFPPSKIAPPLSFEVYLGSHLSPDNLIYVHRPEHRESDDDHLRLEHTTHFQIAGGQFTVRAYTLPGFYMASTTWIPPLILMAGGLISFLTFWLLRNYLQNSLREQARAHQLETINRTGQELAQELELETLANQVVKTASKLSLADWGSLVFFQKDLTRIITHDVATGNTLKQEKNSSHMISRFNRIFQGARVFRADECSTHPELGDFLPWPSQTCHVVGVPLLSRTGEYLGGVFFARVEGKTFSSMEEGFILGLAAQAATALDNARLHGQALNSIKLRDEFMSIASHELKTPITSLRLQLEIAQRYLKGKSETDSKLDKTLKMSLQQISRLTGLIEDLLDVSRIHQGKMSIRPKSFKLKNILREVVEKFEEELTRLQMNIELKIKGELQVCWDESRMEQVFVNLITNAIKYAPGARITIIAEQSGDLIQMEFIDNGPGIPPELLVNIFDKFERADTTRSIQGLGLGLFIVKEIVSLHQGSITVESELGCGARFKMTLPQSAQEYIIPNGSLS